jgi:hypothetical protein
MKPIQKFALLVCTMAALAFGCQKENIGPDGNELQPGTFEAYMTDSPGDYEALHAQIVKVEAYIEGEGWIVLNQQPQMVSVLSLTNGAQTKIAATSNVKAHMGVYSKLRITFGSENRLTINAALAAALGGIAGNGNAIVDLQYDGPREVVIEIDERVSARKGAAVLIDFNVAKSVYQEADHFVLRPTLTLIKNASTGVRGHVEGTATAAVTLSNDSGEFSTFINASGDFLIRGMEDGVYELVVMPGQVLGDIEPMEPQKIEGVVVVEGEITSAGTFSF